MDRRKFLTTTALGGTSMVLQSKGYGAPSVHARPPASRLRLAVIGTGLRGQSHMKMALQRDDCDVVAICDIDPQMLHSAQQLIAEAARPAARTYTGSEQAWRELLVQQDVDAVIVATPWRWHSVMCIEAMKAGKYVGTEVGGAFSIDECWELVRTHETTGTHLYFLENVCFRRDVMAVLQMVRQGVFGELVHLECGYQHDLREVKFNDGRQPYGGGVEFGQQGFSEARWRTIHSVHRNGDLYPTHGIGPVAQYVRINRGNRFVRLSAMASKAKGLHEYIVRHPKGGAEHPNAAIAFKLGDVITTSIYTNEGETIVMRHDTNLPRPYSLGFRVQGTKGLWMDVNQSIYIEGQSPSHRWEPAAPWLKRYDHPLWQRYETRATGAGHGGMDFFLLHSFVEHAKRNEAPPFDVYDAATWMAITPLSEQSIAQGGQPVVFPDFTTGQWMWRTPTFALGDTY